VEEQRIVGRIRRAKVFVFVREHRHELFAEAFHGALAALSADSPLGQPPLAPAQLALALILQASSGVSADKVIEATTMDRRWQLVLDCLDCPEPPCSKGTLVGLRARLIEQHLDRRLIERTSERAASTRGFGARARRVALDSRPLWGAGQGEDTSHLRRARPAHGLGRDCAPAGAGAGAAGERGGRARGGRTDESEGGARPGRG
jgi:transposase